MQSDQLLVACPKCRAWPMAVHAGKRRWASEAPMIRFTCAKCGHQEEERLGAYTKEQRSQQHEISGSGF
jgi:DNA-directed RNA polymerase subunit M/transcription elongation factor TFIIS